MISKVLPSPVQQPIVLYFVVLTDQKLVESTGTEDNENDYNNFILFLAKHTLRSIFSDLIVLCFPVFTDHKLVNFSGTEGRKRVSK